LQKTKNCDTLSVKDGWAICPVCGWDRVQRIAPDTEAKNFPLWCRKCKHETIVNIEQSQSQRARAD